MKIKPNNLMPVTELARRGGKARAAKLSPARKSAIAKQAAAIRWQREKDGK